MKELISISKLSKKYGKQQVLDDLSLHISAGKLIGLLGPNGCGKTTLIKIMSGLLPDYEGQVLLYGHPVGIYTREHVAYLPEKSYLEDWMSVDYAIDMTADFYADFDKAKAKELLTRFSLSSQRRFKTMSKGMQEKLQLILVICRRAKLYLLDEPLSGVDVTARDAILDLILKYYAEDSGLLISTHLISDVERLFDEVVFLGRGKVLVHDSADGIRETKGKSVEEYFREVFSCSQNY